MKILGINGSPNKNGSTAMLIDMLLDECSKVGAFCERVDIEDFVTCPCEECNIDNECHISDDYYQLNAKMMDADGIIIGSPYYNGKATEQIEAFFNKLSAANNRLSFVDKYFVGVSTSSVSDCKSIAQYCATLGTPLFPVNGIISGLLHEAVMMDNLFQDFRTDEALKKRVESVAASLMDDIKNRRATVAYKLKRLVADRPAKLVLSKRTGKKYSIINKLSYDTSLTE